MEPTFGARLTSWLEFVGMRQADLARALDVSRRAVHAWMHDDAAPTTDRIVPIVEALKIPGGVAEFFARMPTLEAEPKDDDEAAIGPHPRTGDITRELDAAAIDRALGLRPDEACPTCGEPSRRA
jgi:transcriptional regulator with XRE-family HTH domain